MLPNGQLKQAGGGNQQRVLRVWRMCVLTLMAGLLATDTIISILGYVEEHRTSDGVDHLLLLAGHLTGKKHSRIREATIQSGLPGLSGRGFKERPDGHSMEFLEAYHAPAIPDGIHLCKTHTGMCFPLASDRVKEFCRVEDMEKAAEKHHPSFWDGLLSLGSSLVKPVMSIMGKFKRDVDGVDDEDPACANCPSRPCSAGVVIPSKDVPTSSFVRHGRDLRYLGADSNSTWPPAGVFQYSVTNEEGIEEVVYSGLSARMLDACFGPIIRTREGVMTRYVDMECVHSTSAR